MTVRDERILYDLCVSCGKEKDRKGYYCNACNAMYNVWKNDHACRYHIEGRCTNCGNELDREGWLCKICARKANTHGRERSACRRLNGLCVQCGRPTEGYSQCRDCLDQLKDRRAKNK